MDVQRYRGVDRGRHPDRWADAGDRGSPERIGIASDPRKVQGLERAQSGCFSIDTMLAELVNTYPLCDADPPR